MTRRLLFLILAAGFAGLVVSFVNPVNNTQLRLVNLLSLTAVYFSVVLLLTGRLRNRMFCLSAPVLVLAILFLGPGESTQEVYEDYLLELRSFEGTKYVWGGETQRGIDCSGLPRRAYRNALLSSGLRNWNGSELRAWLGQWWFDTSARALGEGYRMYTAPLAKEGIIKTMSFEGLRPGDIAITTNGLHALVYLGDMRWIQAAPEVGKVKTFHARIDENPWLRQPVSLHRWTRFQDSPESSDASR